MVVITGASSGIGKAAAIKFAKKNAKVVLVARRREKLLQVQKEISQYTDSKNSIVTPRLFAITKNETP